MKETKENVQPKPRAKFYVEKNSALVHAAVIFMALSAVFRLVGCWGMWGDQFFAASQIGLPLVCNLLFILFILLLGGRAFWTTSLPVILGVVFFIIKSFTFDSWLHTVLCILLYMLVAVLYSATAFGIIRTKWLLVPLFGLPFVYHIAVEDAAALRAGTVTFAAGMQEVSVLCIMLALLFTALAMKKRKTIEDVELPKIKGPKVIVPAKPAADAAASAPKPAAVPAAAPETADSAVDAPAQESAAAPAKSAVPDAEASPAPAADGTADAPADNSDEPSSGVHI